MQDTILSFEEFEERFWNYIADELVSNRDIQDNTDWANMIVHEAWRVHANSKVPYNVVMKTVEQVFTAYKTYKPNMLSMLI
jgi:hypothetical protein